MTVTVLGLKVKIALKEMQTTVKDVGGEEYAVLLLKPAVEIETKHGIHENIYMMKNLWKSLQGQVVVAEEDSHVCQLPGEHVHKLS